MLLNQIGKRINPLLTYQRMQTFKKDAGYIMNINPTQRIWGWKKSLNMLFVATREEQIRQHKCCPLLGKPTPVNALAVSPHYPECSWEPPILRNDKQMHTAELNILSRMASTCLIVCEWRKKHVCMLPERQKNFCWQNSIWVFRRMLLIKSWVGILFFR